MFFHWNLISSLFIRKICFTGSKKKKNAKPLSFKVGIGKVIRGWDEALLTMSKGEKARLEIEPEWAYGKKGQPDAKYPFLPCNSRGRGGKHAKKDHLKIKKMFRLTSMSGIIFKSVFLILRCFCVCTSNIDRQ